VWKGAEQCGRVNIGAVNTVAVKVVFPPMIPTLETERLILREYRQTDLDAYAAMAADPEVMHFFDDQELDRARAWRQMALFAGHWSLRGYGLWIVELKKTGEFLGRVGLWEPEGWPGTEVGWALARQHWGHGYATEAARASIQFGFNDVGVSELISLIDVGNDASVRVAERVGMKLREEIIFHGKPILVYSIDQAAHLTNQTQK
jgi:RimJ/RimL family protein N-acetyltransferase